MQRHIAMECGICLQRVGQRRPANCASCARATIYEPRIEQLQALLEKEQVHKQIATVLRSPSDLAASSSVSQNLTVDLTEGSKKTQTEDWRRQIEAINVKVEGVEEQQGLLRQQIQEGRSENASRKQTHKDRRAEIQRELEQLRSRQGPLTEPLQTDIRRLNNRLRKVSNRLAQGRAQLCRETAHLAGLSMRRRRSKDGKTREDISIGGISITDLRDLNTASPDHVSASLANVSRLLVTCCHYLSIRLPAEVLCAHPDFPQPAMLSLQSSYQTPERVPANLSQSTLNSPSSSRTLLGRLPRPKLRPLHLDKPLPRLAKEDPASYNLFIEGVTLLAWDVAWLCRTEGVTAIDTWEDVCAVGRNLWLLFMVDSASNDSGQTGTTTPTPSNVSVPVDFGAPRLGEYSHGSSFKNLAGPEGTELFRTWQLPSLARISDKVKSHLLTEMSGAEWELLDEKEWNEEREDEQAVLVGGERRESGWMKLKSRADETR